MNGSKIGTRLATSRGPPHEPHDAAARDRGQVVDGGRGTGGQFPLRDRAGADPDLHREHGLADASEASRASRPSWSITSETALGSTARRWLIWLTRERAEGSTATTM